MNLVWNFRGYDPISAAVSKTLPSNSSLNSPNSGIGLLYADSGFSHGNSRVFCRIGSNPVFEPRVQRPIRCIFTSARNLMRNFVRLHTYPPPRMTCMYPPPMTYIVYPDLHTLLYTVPRDRLSNIFNSFSSPLVSARHEFRNAP